MFDLFEKIAMFFLLGFGAVCGTFMTITLFKIERILQLILDEQRRSNRKP